MNEQSIHKPTFPGLDNVTEKWQTQILSYTHNVHSTINIKNSTNSTTNEIIQSMYVSFSEWCSLTGICNTAYSTT